MTDPSVVFVAFTWKHFMSQFDMIFIEFDRRLHKADQKYVFEKIEILFIWSRLLFNNMGDPSLHVCQFSSTNLK